MVGIKNIKSNIRWGAFLLLGLTFNSQNTWAACESSKSPTDQSLVVAIDVSQSVDDTEMSVQMNGYQRAFLNPKVERVFLGCGCSEISVLLWAGGQATAVESRKIKTRADLLAISDEFGHLSGMKSDDFNKYYKTGFTTEVSDALEASYRFMQTNKTSYLRSILISGDGPQKEYTEAEFESLKQRFRYDGIRVYAAPIVVYEDSRRGKYEAHMRDLGREDEPLPFGSREELIENANLRAAPQFYQKHVVTHPNYLEAAESYQDLQRALVESLQKMQCLIM